MIPNHSRVISPINTPCFLDLLQLKRVTNLSWKQKLVGFIVCVVLASAFALLVSGNETHLSQFSVSKSCEYCHGNHLPARAVVLAL